MHNVCQWGFLLSRVNPLELDALYSSMMTQGMSLNVSLSPQVVSLVLPI